jgi:hypothetical protein
MYSNVKQNKLCPLSVSISCLSTCLPADLL